MTVPLRRPTALGAAVDVWGGVLDEGLRGLVVDRMARPEDADDAPGALTVVTRAKGASRLGRPFAVLVAESLAARVPAGVRWVHPSPAVVLAGLLEEPLPVDERDRALIDPGAEVHETAVVRAFAVVRTGAVVGPGTVIGEGAVIFPRVTLGARVFVGPHAVVGRPGFGWALGANGVARIPQLGGVVVDDDVEIGAHATVDAGTLGPTRLGRGVKLDAHVHVGHNVEIGAGTLVAAQTGFAGSVRVGRGVLVGGQVGVGDHVEVGDGAKLAAKAGVIGDVPDGATYAGYPAVERSRWLRGHARLYRRR